MLPTPTKFTLLAGSAEGGSKLNAFDNALLNAGIGNLNLVRVSSILPPQASFTERLDIPYGSLVPTAYGCITSDVPGERIAAAVGVGIDDKGCGVIMEFSGKTTRDGAEMSVREMVEEAFKARGMNLATFMVKAVEHTVERNGCAFAAVALWY